MKRGDFFRFKSKDFSLQMGARNLILFYPSPFAIPNKLRNLPSKKFWHSDVPAWRNTTGFFKDFAQVSYQSDLEPLPNSATLLTFHPFIQYSQIRNYLLILNTIDDPVVRTGKLFLYNSQTCKNVGEEKIFTNSVTCIDLDKYEFEPHTLPVFYSPDMAAIPFGFGVSTDGKMLSLEHTHPPASFVLFGDRRKVQSQIKKSWAERLTCHD
jgi:hypothetical protein